MALAAWTFAWVYPAGFYVGRSDSYLAHNLYTSNTQHALFTLLNPTKHNEAIHHPLAWQ